MKREWTDLEFADWNPSAVGRKFRDALRGGAISGTTGLSVPTAFRPQQSPIDQQAEESTIRSHAAAELRSQKTLQLAS